jgi:arabinan endo-1,5-alpha-L-arabinosidase
MHLATVYPWIRSPRYALLGLSALACQPASTSACSEGNAACPGSTPSTPSSAQASDLGSASAGGSVNPIPASASTVGTSGSAYASSATSTAPASNSTPAPSASSPASAVLTGNPVATPSAASASDAGNPVSVPSGSGSNRADSGAPNAGDDRCDVGVDDGMPPQVLSLSGDTFAHDPTMIEADGVFYRYWTGDNIPMASSVDLLQWKNGPAVYRDGYPTWVAAWRADNPGNTFNFPWAPDVSFFNGQYHMYASFSAFFGKNISCISHLTTPDIAAGDWVDHGPVICTDGSQDFNAIDPDVGIDTEGKAWLAFGSFWDGILAFELDAAGNRVGNTLTRLAWAPQIEAPVLFRRCGYYYLFVSWGLCCPGENRSVNDLTYRVVVGRSENILGPYVDRDGVPLLDGGGTLVVEGDGVNFAAAGHGDVLTSGNKMYHLYHAYRQSNGNATLRISYMPFDEAGWPVPSGP